MMNTEKQENKFTLKTFIKEWIIPILAAIVIVLLIHRFLFFTVNVPSTSMVPTIKVNDKFVITRIYDTNSIKRGEILVFQSDELNKRLIKRVIGLPGDHIVIHNGIVNVNGTDLEEDYVKHNERYNGTFDVPEGKFFFLGDNRPNSDDSRMWENPYIDAKDIEGRAVLRFYPFNNMGSMK